MTEVYGDVEWQADLAELALPIIALTTAERHLEALRALLIGCGQIEQLVSDAQCAPDWLRLAACSATDHAAAAFYANWSRANAPDLRAGWTVQAELELLRRDLSSLASVSLRGIAKVPEGFAFYRLFPDQYCASVVRYLRQHRHSADCVHVIGLRSIGTTLSAIVAAVLRAAGRAYRRYTVRPNGHPFARSLELSTRFAPGDLAFVVDEGPGLSGSSFHAVHEALRRARVEDARQVFFCGHDSGPGPMASPSVRAFWCHAKRYAASVEEPSFSHNGSLTATLAAEVGVAFGSSVTELIDCSSGRWRAYAYQDLADWPPSYSPFERPKWLARLSDERSVLLKFYGQVLLADSDGVQISDAAAARAIGAEDVEARRIHGYVARPWRAGRLLRLADKSPSIIDSLGAFLGARHWRRLSPTMSAADGCYGCSGQLAPQEWIFDAAGELHKLPESLQGYDHTAIDAQPLGWDLAGAIVEWELSRAEAERLLVGFASHSRLSVTLAALAPHIRRYAEFCAAKSAFCAMHAQSSEASLLQGAAARYASRASGDFDD